MFDGLVESAVTVDRTIDVQAVFHSGEVVVVSVPGSGVHGAGSGVERDVVGKHAQRVAVDERMARLHALELRALEGGRDRRRSPAELLGH